MQHETGIPDGENLAFGWCGYYAYKYKNTPLAVENWYKEEENYNYSTNKSNGGEVGHFT